MQTYVIRRPGIANGAAELDAALMRLRFFEEQPPAMPARWLRSYALREADGRFGLSCVFQADGAQALERHAERIALPASDIRPVTATMPMRAFAPTMVYRVRRRQAWRSATELDRSAALWRRVADDDMPREVSWLHSYAVDEGDRTLGSVCFYQAVSRDALLDHARRAGLPADEITAVVGRIVFRDDPAFEALPGRPLPA